MFSKEVPGYDYPALAIYPKVKTGNRTPKEYLFVTRPVKNRLKRFLIWSKNYSLLMLNEMTKCTHTMRWFIKEDIVYPSISGYFNLMRAMYGKRWKDHLQKDVNYAYAYVKYPPEEIERRVRRLHLPSRYKGENPKYVGYKYISEELGISTVAINRAAHYLRGRSACVYGKLMLWISEQERILGFDDRMILERE